MKNFYQIYYVKQIISITAFYLNYFKTFEVQICVQKFSTFFQHFHIRFSFIFQHFLILKKEIYNIYTLSLFFCFCSAFYQINFKILYFFYVSLIIFKNLFLIFTTNFIYLHQFVTKTKYLTYFSSNFSIFTAILYFNSLSRI